MAKETKEKIWKQITYLRSIVKTKKSPTFTDRKTGEKRGGIPLTEETIKPWEEKLAATEAKLKQLKKDMSTKSINNRI